MTTKPRRYGQWAGSPEGSPEDPTLCIEEVSRGFFFHQCSRKRGKGPDGLYCTQHVPETVAAKREARNSAARKRNDAAWYICRKPEHDAFDALLAAAETASRALHEFHPREFHIAVGQGICTWKPCQALFLAIALAKKKEQQP